MRVARAGRFAVGSAVVVLVAGAAADEPARQVGQAVLLWASLAFLSILLLAIGLFWFIVANGRRLRRRPRDGQPKRYFDLRGEWRALEPDSEEKGDRGPDQR